MKEKLVSVELSSTLEEYRKKIEAQVLDQIKFTPVILILASKDDKILKKLEKSSIVVHSLFEKTPEEVNSLMLQSNRKNNDCF